MKPTFSENTTELKSSVKLNSNEYYFLKHEGSIIPYKTKF
jgi:hypothetical protein